MEVLSENKIDHVVVLQHGLHGFPSTFDSLVTLLKNKLASDNYHFHIAISNSGKFLITHDGIDVGGKRLVEEIEMLRQNLKLEKGTKLTLIGHSLGGLYCRYAIGYMFEKGILENWELKQLITFASPHLGARKSPSQWVGILSSVASFYCRNIISRTGLQLIYEDSDLGPPLLQQMADPEGPYFLALKKFQRRVLYSNIANDIQVGFTSGAIWSTNPYSKITLGPEHYDKVYPHLVLREDIILEQIVQSTDKGNELFKDDPMAEMLSSVLTNLQSIKWERYPIHFTHPLGHDLIIGRWSLAVDIIKHAVDNFVV